MAEDALMIHRRAKTRIERKRNKFFKAVAEMKVLKFREQRGYRVRDCLPVNIN